MIEILVTGANGQLGNELRKIASQFDGFHIVFTDVDTLNLIDFELLEQYFAQKNFDWIINCAAYTAVDKAESEVKLAQLVNAEVTGNLAKLCKKHNIKLIHISTDYIFDGKNYKPYIEDDPPNPISVYGRSKWEGEVEISKSNAQAIIIRTSWLYSSFGQNFVKNIMRLAQERKKLNIIYDQVGTPTYAGDLAYVLLQIVQKVKTEKADFSSLMGIYHYSNEGISSWYDFATEIVRLSKLDCQIVPIETKEYPTPAQRPLYGVLNKSKIKSTFQLTIPHWNVSLEKCIELLQNQQYEQSQANVERGTT